jgi:hypothetical protein
MTPSTIRVLTLLAIPVGLLLAVYTVRAEFGPRYDDARFEAPYPGLEQPTEILAEPFAFAVDVVVDEQVGFRPRADQTLPSGARTTKFGLWSDEDLSGRVLTGPRVLWVGDELVAGGVENASAAPMLLQSSLRAAGKELAGTTVVDASCPGYSLYQVVKRAGALVPHVDPHLVVLVVHGGNDIVELVDESRPHIDSRGFETDPLVNPPTTLRQNLGVMYGKLLPGSYDSCFYQSGWLHLQSQRAEDLDRRLRSTLALVGRIHDGPTLIVYVPPWDLITGVGADRASLGEDGPTEFAHTIAASDRQAAWADRTLAYLRRTGVAWLDARELLVADDEELEPGRAARGDAPPREPSFLPDTRLSPAGHARLARGLRERILRLLEASY